MQRPRTPTLVWGAGAGFDVTQLAVLGYSCWHCLPIRGRGVQCAQHSPQVTVAQHIMDEIGTFNLSTLESAPTNSGLGSIEAIVGETLEPPVTPSVGSVGHFWP